MIKIREHPGTNILEFEIDGRTTKEDFGEIAGKIDAIIQEHGTVRIIKVIRKLGGVQPAAVWEDIKWAPSHIKAYTHAAVVAEEAWVEWLVACLRPLIGAELRYYRLDDLDDAREWIRGAD